MNTSGMALGILARQMRTEIQNSLDNDADYDDEDGDSLGEWQVNIGQWDMDINGL